MIFHERISINKISAVDITPPMRHTDSISHGSTGRGQSHPGAVHCPRTKDRLLDNCVDAERYVDG